MFQPVPTIGKRVHAIMKNWRLKRVRGVLNRGLMRLGRT